MSFRIFSKTLWVLVAVSFTACATARAAVNSAGHGAVNGVVPVLECSDLFREISIPAHSISRTGSVQVNGRTMYYEQIVAQPQKRTAVVFTGLATKMVEFANLKQEFLKQSNGEGLILLSYSTHPESLLAGFSLNPETYANHLELELGDIVSQAEAVLNDANVQGPVAVVGYSYGAAPAARFVELRRALAQSLLFVTPLIMPGDHIYQFHAASQMVRSFASLNPYLGRAFLKSTREMAARTIAYQTLSDDFKDSRLPKGFKHETLIVALTQLIHSVEDFDLRSENFAAWPVTSFLIAKDEVPSRLQLQRELIAQVRRQQGADGATIVVDSEHEVMRYKPAEAASVILQVLRSSTENQ